MNRREEQGENKIDRKMGKKKSILSKRRDVSKRGRKKKADG